MKSPQGCGPSTLSGTSTGLPSKRFRNPRAGPLLQVTHDILLAQLHFLVLPSGWAHVGLGSNDCHLRPSAVSGYEPQVKCLLLLFRRGQHAHPGVWRSRVTPQSYQELPGTHHATSHTNIAADADYATHRQPCQNVAKQSDFGSQLSPPLHKAKTAKEDRSLDDCGHSKSQCPPRKQASPVFPLRSSDKSSPACETLLWKSP